MQRIKTLILGLGRIAYQLETDPYRHKPCSHVGTLLSPFGKRNFQILAAYDKDPKKIELFLQESGVSAKKVITDYSEIKKQSFDLCIIATSSHAHYDNALLAIDLKIPNLLIEKPACLLSSELKHLLQLQKVHKTRIWVNHERRYHPVYALVKKMLSEQKYGQIVTIHASVLTSGFSPGNAYQENANLPSGPLLHDGTHAIDYIQWLLGYPQKIEGKMVKPYKGAKIEAQALALLTYPDNVHVFLETGGYRKYFQFEIDIQTTEARFILSNDGHRFYKAEESELYSGFRSLKPFELPKISKNKQSAWSNLYREIAETIHGKNENQTGTLEDNLQILEIIEAIYRGEHTGYSFLS